MLSFAKERRLITDHGSSPLDPKHDSQYSSLFHSTPDTRHSTLSPHDTPKPQMTGRGIDGLRHARGRPVAPAVIRRAEIRPALHHLARNLDVRRVGIVAFLLLCASRIHGSAAGMRDLAVFLIPVRSPFPNVSCHFVEPIAVRWKAAYRPNAFKNRLRSNFARGTRLARCWPCISRWESAHRLR